MAFGCACKHAPASHLGAVQILRPGSYNVHGLGIIRRVGRGSAFTPHLGRLAMVQVYPRGTYNKRLAGIEQFRMRGGFNGLSRRAVRGLGTLGLNLTTLSPTLTQTVVKYDATTAATAAGASAAASTAIGAGAGLVGAAVIANSESKLVNDTVYGAEIGSVIPGVGTVVGAALGAVVGVIQSVFGNHDVRVASQDYNSCVNFLNQYMQAAAQAGDTPLGPQLGETALQQLNWCLQAVYGHFTGDVDPRFFDGGYQTGKQIATQLIQQCFSTPVGSPIVLQGSSVSVGNQTFTWNGTSFINPQIITLQQLRDLYMALNNAACKVVGSNPSTRGGCDQLDAQAVVQRWNYDWLGYMAVQLLPNINKDTATPPTAAQVAAAPNVAQVVSQITSANAVSAPISVTTDGSNLTNVDWSKIQNAITTAINSLTTWNASLRTQLYNSVVQWMGNPSNSGLSATVTTPNGAVSDQIYAYIDQLSASHFPTAAPSATIGTPVATTPTGQTLTAAPGPTVQATTDAGTPVTVAIPPPISTSGQPVSTGPQMITATGTDSGSAADLATLQAIYSAQAQLAQQQAALTAAQNAQAQNSSGLSLNTAGFSWVEIAFLVAVAIPLIMGVSGDSHHRSR